MEKLISTEMMASVQTGMCVLRKDDAMDDNGEIIITHSLPAPMLPRAYSVLTDSRSEQMFWTWEAVYERITHSVIILINTSFRLLGSPDVDIRFDRLTYDKTYYRCVPLTSSPCLTTVWLPVSYCCALQGRLS